MMSTNCWSRQLPTTARRVGRRSSRTPLWLPLALGLLALPLPAFASRDVATRIREGEIVTVSVPGTPGVLPGRAMGVIDAPPEVVRQILTGFQSYKSFVPRITASRRVKDNRFVIECDLPWPVNKTWAYLATQTGNRNGILVVTWKMLNGTLKSYEGVAWIHPWGNGRSLLTYQMLAVPHTAAPNAILTSGLRDAVTTMVESVRKEAARVLAARAHPGTQVAAQPSHTH